MESLGQFEQLVLTAVYLLGDTGYSVSVTDKVTEMASKRIMIGTVFVSLNRLESRGLVESRFAEPTPERGGKAKRYFQITAAGRSALAQTRTTAELLTNLLGPLKEYGKT